MTRYFFNRTDGHVEEDNEGTELPSLDAARVQAIVYAGASLKDDPEFIWNGQELRIEVTDEAGIVLFTVITHAIDNEQQKPVSGASHPSA